MDESFFTQDFETFARGLSRFDLALYGGLALVLWVLFKDKLNPLTDLVNKGIIKLKELLNQKRLPTTTIDITVPNYIKEKNKEDVFFDLVVSWKKTRDLAVSAGCDEAVQVADKMFPFLSPSVCNKSKDDVQ
jgi:hypothetical protein